MNQIEQSKLLYQGVTDYNVDNYNFYMERLLARLANKEISQADFDAAKKYYQSQIDRPMGLAVLF